MKCYKCKRKIRQLPYVFEINEKIVSICQDCMNKEIPFTKIKSHHQEFINVLKKIAQDLYLELYEEIKKENEVE